MLGSEKLDPGAYPTAGPCSSASLQRNWVYVAVCNMHGVPHLQWLGKLGRETKRLLYQDHGSGGLSASRLLRSPPASKHIMNCFQHALICLTPTPTHTGALHTRARSCLLSRHLPHAQRTHNTRAPTSNRRTGICAIWACISSSSSSVHLFLSRASCWGAWAKWVQSAQRPASSGGRERQRS